MRYIQKGKVSLNLKCVMIMVDKQLRDCINAITVTDRFRKRKKKNPTYIRSGWLEYAYHSPLTYIKLDIFKTVMAELSQSVHHFTQQ